MDLPLLKSKYIAVRSAISTLKKMKSKDTWDGLGFLVRPSWGLRRLQPVLRQLETEIELRALQMLHEEKPIRTIAGCTGLSDRRVRLLSRSYRARFTAKVTGNPLDLWIETLQLNHKQKTLAAGLRTAKTIR